MTRTIRSALAPTEAIDIAILGAIAEGAREPAAIAAAVRALCRPWLSPTGDFVRAHLARHLDAGRARRTRGRRAELRLTPFGERSLRSMLLAGIVDPPHHLAELHESLRVAFADRLAPADRAAMRSALLGARARCLDAQRERLVDPPIAPGALARLLGHRVALAEARLAALGRVLAAESTDSPSGSERLA